MRITAIFLSIFAVVIGGCGQTAKKQVAAAENIV
jgi:hypothetical protein